jgi:hypothetical protein
MTKNLSLRKKASPKSGGSVESRIQANPLVKGKIVITCPKCGVDRGKEIGGIGKPCPQCGFNSNDILEQIKFIFHCGSINTQQFGLADLKSIEDAVLAVVRQHRTEHTKKLEKWFKIFLETIDFENVCQYDEEDSKEWCEMQMDFFKQKLNEWST